MGGWLGVEEEGGELRWRDEEPGVPCLGSGRGVISGRRSVSVVEWGNA